MEGEVIPLKTCGCGRRYTIGAWVSLRLVGSMKDDVEHLELRDCEGCGSTISVRVLYESPDSRFYETS